MIIKTAAIIPARYASVRFPGKPLALLAGKPIIEHVYKAASDSGLFDVITVATDNETIRNAVEKFGGKVIMTSSEHKSGSDRIAEANELIKADLIVNIQGDEPFISQKPLKELLSAFNDANVQVASLMHKICKKEIADPNNVKVVCDNLGFAMYFSRSPIPFDRDGKSNIEYMKHVGVYAFRSSALNDFVSLPEGKLEVVEKLEQLRYLENGFRIKMIRTEYLGIGIDTPQDLEKAEQLYFQIKKEINITKQCD